MVPVRECVPFDWYEDRIPPELAAIYGAFSDMVASSLSAMDDCRSRVPHTGMQIVASSARPSECLGGNALFGKAEKGRYISVLLFQRAITQYAIAGG